MFLSSFLLENYSVYGFCICNNNNNNNTTNNISINNTKAATFSKQCVRAHKHTHIQCQHAKKSISANAYIDAKAYACTRTFSHAS